MKKNLTYILCIFIVVTTSFCLSSCGKQNDNLDLWASAIYTRDTELGSGEKCITVEIAAQEKTVTLKINTDKKTLGDALLEHNLIAGDKGPYGLYVKFVNGIEADYNKTQAFWAISKNGESLLTGADFEEISDGGKYEFTYTKN